MASLCGSSWKAIPREFRVQVSIMVSGLMAKLAWSKNTQVGSLKVDAFKSFSFQESFQVAFLKIFYLLCA